MLPESIATSRALAVVGLVFFLVDVLAFAWGLFKLSRQRVTGVPVPRNRLTIGLDIATEFSRNLLGAVSRAVKLTTGRSLFWPTLALPEAPLRDSMLPPRPAAPTPIKPEAGHIRAGLLGVVLLVTCAGYALRCHPQLPPVSGCTAGSWACIDDVPSICSASHRWEPRGDERCAAQQRVCAVTVTDAGARARCARVTVTTDGGSDAADQ